MRKAVVILADGYVENVIEVEEGANWKPPEGCILIDALDASPGDTWDGGKFVRPELPEPEPVRNLLAEIDDLKARVEKLEKK